MTHKIGNNDYNLNQVIWIGPIIETSKKYFSLYFKFSGQNGVIVTEDDFPDLEGERAVIIGKLNQK